MKLTTPRFALAAVFVGAAVASPVHEKRANPKGVDISSYQGTVDFKTLVSNGISFVYIKATEGTSKHPSFSRSKNNMHTWFNEGSLSRPGFFC